MANFNQIAGYSKVKEELMKLRNMLLNMEEYEKTGLRIPSGVLLYGAPGVGKTVMARAISANPIKCIELCSADCTRENAVDYILKSFEEARKNIPSVLLIDEIDKVAEESESFFMESNNQVMKILLQELDGKKNKGVLVIATCNDFGNMNDALLRSGRFDRIIQIPKPNNNDRKEIIRYYFDRIKMEKKIDEGYIAKITGNFTGAELECLINESGILAKEKGENAISIKHIQTIINRNAFRALEEEIIDESEKNVVAVHEAGHALLALLLRPDNFTCASILPQGQVKGHISLCNDVEITKKIEELKDQIIIAFGGVAAERIIFQENYLSSEDDYTKAFYLTDTLITQVGAYGVEYIFPRARGVAMSQKLENSIGDKRTELLKEFSAKAEELLRNNYSILNKIVRGLIECNSLNKEELIEIMQSA